jgi:uncharacterized membrane protein
MVGVVVHIVASFDVLLLAIYALEVCAVLWLLPLGASSQGIEKQRLFRFLLPVMALVLLSMFFLLLSIGGPAISSEYAVAASTPLLLGVTVYQAKEIVRARRQRHFYRHRQGMP